MSAPVDAELAEAVACVKRIHALRRQREGDPHSWSTLLAMLQGCALAAELRVLGPPRGHAAEAEPTITPEQTLREAGIGSKRQAAYQRMMSALLAGRQTAPPAAMGRPRLRKRAPVGARGAGEA